MAWDAELFEEPHLFLRDIQKLLFEGNLHLPLGSDGQIQSEGIRYKQSRMFAAAVKSMSKLTELSIRYDYVPGTICLLASSPLTKLVLEKCCINQEAADALAHVVQNCTTLKKIEIMNCKKESTNFSPILLAVSECMSIRHFTFMDDGRNFDCREFDSVLRLIKSSRTLRTLYLTDIVCSISQMCQALDALKSNTSLWKFDCLPSGELPLWPESSEIEESSLNKRLLELISCRNTLTSVYISLAIHKNYPILCKDPLVETFKKNNNLLSMRLKDRRFNDGVDAYKSIPEVHSLKDLAAVVFKIGRVLSGESLVCCRLS